jgi:putative transposase
MKKQRYTVEEIAAKLAEADAMSAQGRLHGDIAKALGVSLMTYHRWRKARKEVRKEPDLRVSESWHLKAQAPLGSETSLSQTEQTKRISELQLENSRLRRIVTDLLLEKLNLEESIHGWAADVKRAGRL